mmetsp:Transcript_7843/g.15791  ORF Transcript_7843/g.15791 Transcript_7843/m.15791 type:complete len:286 (-) Transcript_7843:448-1305(-)
MLVKEYRLLLPLTAEEYHIAQLYMVAKSSQLDTGKDPGEGIEIVRNEPYTENEHGMPPGQYTEKIFHLKSKIPKFISVVIPNPAMELIEYSWNAFPKCLTIYENKWLGDKFFMSVETMHANDRGEQENAVGLNQEDLAQRGVDYLNIACDDPSVKMVPGEDPREFLSEKTGRGQLQSKWFETYDPCMCAYKVVKLHFKVRGIQSKVEQWGQYYGMRAPFITYHRKLFCWIDEWYGLTIQDIRTMEEETKVITKKKLEESKTSGAPESGKGSGTRFGRKPSVPANT